MRRAFTIPGRLPGLNDYIKACRTSPQVGNRMKDEAEAQIAWAILAAGAAPVHGLVRVRFVWIEPDRRRDKDNISSMGRKFILDVLKPFDEKRNKYGQNVIDGDGWSHVESFTDDFAVDRDNPRIIVAIEEVH